MAPSALPRECPVAHKAPGTDDNVTNRSSEKSSPPQHPSVPSKSTVQLPRRCPVAHKVQASRYEELEQDFTTQGKPSSLECPFAIKSKNGMPADAGERDPIAAEFHPDMLSAQSLDESNACNRCPIRFLDKHSPEEIAQYFEKHKHELPRSHEICVKRYQTNEQSIRQLDAKYGNLVSMIQGLGNKHKQFLPSDEQGATSTTDQRSSSAVKNWAKGVRTEDVAEADVGVEPDHRMSHFEKPLREVRVGESPTRPWGIHVPVDMTSKSGPPSIKVESHRSGTKVTNDAPPQAASTVASQSTSRTSSRRAKKRHVTHINFNGPVFLGYSPEQAALFLQQLSVRQNN